MACEPAKRNYAKPQTCLKKRARRPKIRGTLLAFHDRWPGSATGVGRCSLLLIPVVIGMLRSFMSGRSVTPQVETSEGKESDPGDR